MNFANTIKKITPGQLFFLLAVLIIFAGACQKHLNPLPPDGGGGDSTHDSTGDSTGGGGDSTIVVIPKDYNIFGLYAGQSASEDIIDFTSDPRYQYNLTNAKDIALAKQYGVKYYRMQVSHDRWITDTGKTNFINYIGRVIDSSLLPVLNVNWNETDQIPDPFPDANEYRIFLTEVLDSLNANQLKPEVIVVENEPANFNNYNYL